MFVFFGTRKYGKTDQIKNVGYVATEFFHVQFVPLIPIRSVFVLGNKDTGSANVQIPLSFKSVLLAWLRAGLLLLGVSQIVVAGVLFSEGETSAALIPTTLTLITFAVYLFTVMKTGIGKASESKQEQLGEFALQAAQLPGRTE